MTDSMLKIQSARATLGEVDRKKLPNGAEIDGCLQSADESLKVALGYAKGPKSAKEQSEPRV